MKYTLKAWTKPGTEDTRIYINGGPLDRGDKLFIFAATSKLTNKPSWDAKLYSDFSTARLTNRGLGSNAYDIALTIAEQALTERGLGQASFAEILKAISQ